MLATIYTNEIVGNCCPYGVDDNTIVKAINSKLVDLIKSNEIPMLHNGQEVEVNNVETYIYQTEPIPLQNYDFMRIKICIILN